MECVAEVHEEDVALPEEMVVDVGIGNPCMMQEVVGCDSMKWQTKS